MGNVNEEMFVTAVDKAYATISKKILTGELKPGSKLSKRKMAEMTGVSVIPVIDALNRLEGDGLVESKPQWGTYVTIPSKEKIIDVYSLREAIECQVALLLSGKLTKEQEGQLRLLANETDNLQQSEDSSDTVMSSHFQFHMKMAEFTGMSTLIDTLKKVNLFNLLCRAVSSRRKRSQIPNDWHNQLIDVLMNGNENEAIKKMREHIHDSLNSIIQDTEGI